MGCLRSLAAFLSGGLLFFLEGQAAWEPICNDPFAVQGIGNVSLIPTGWNVDGGREKVEVQGTKRITTNMGGRAYFAAVCLPGVYDPKQYLALDLRGKTLKYTADMSGVGCGCNAAFYLTSLHQNTNASDCTDYYCDANRVCGVSCSEIDIQEGNQFSWRSTLHSSHDHIGLSAGYGCGGPDWSGPRDWNSTDFGPGGRCIDTRAPFEVSVCFPTNFRGALKAMEVTLTQQGHRCPLSVSLGGNYSGMAELDAALAAGMTPIISYWNASDMLWMDGEGADGQGPCAEDTPTSCAESVGFYGFAVTPAFPPTTPNPEWTGDPSPTVEPRRTSVPDLSTSPEAAPEGPPRGPKPEGAVGGARAVLLHFAVVLALATVLPLGVWALCRFGPQEASVGLSPLDRKESVRMHRLLIVESGVARP